MVNGTLSKSGGTFSKRFRLDTSRMLGTHRNVGTSNDKRSRRHLNLLSMAEQLGSGGEALVALFADAHAACRWFGFRLPPRHLRRLVLLVVVLGEPVARGEALVAFVAVTTKGRKIAPKFKPNATD